MPRSEPTIPLSVVKELLEQERSHARTLTAQYIDSANRQSLLNAQLLDKLGLFLVQAAEKYEQALNPPVHQPSGEEMSYTRLSEEEEDLQFQLESGLISVDQYSPAMKRVLANTDLSLEP